MIVSVTPELALDVGRSYAGGLGVLEGDKFYAAARLGVDYLVITLHYPEGYVSYVEEDGELVPVAERNELPTREVGRGRLRVRGGEVEVSYHEYVQGSARAIFVRVEGPEWAAAAVRRLYIEGTEADRFYKYVILARAAVDYLERFVGWEAVRRLDLQEAYTALVLLVRRHPRARVVIHTPAPWGHPTFSRRFFREEFGFDMAMERVVLTEVGLAASSEGIVVSRRMVDLACSAFPHHCHRIRPVTNAVEVPRWRHPALAEVASPEELARRRAEVRREALGALGIDAGGRVVISWARRMTGYKRPHFVLQLAEDLDRDVLFLVGGRAHPDDAQGLAAMRALKRLAASRPNVRFLPDLDVARMRLVIWASDLWAFTPLSAWEASGTSFMKAGVNGVPSVASRDGAVTEVVRDGYNGWLFGEDRRSLPPLEDRELDSREYEEFRRKVEEALEAYSGGKYWEVAYNAYRTFGEFASMDRLFKEYGYI